MAWKWQLEDATGTAITSAAVPSTEFPSRSEAESWIGEVFGELVEDGVDQVRLFEDGREVYGPMSLHAED